MHAPSTRPMVEQLVEPVARARAQADRLAASVGGALEHVPSGKAPTSPDAVRAEAEALAPPGLCDDPTMQAPDSPVCPLTFAQRSALREHVVGELGQIAAHWRDAAHHAHIRKRLEPLLAKTGNHPLLDILVSVATGWIGGQIASLITGQLRAHATRTLAREVNVFGFDTSDLKPPVATSTPHDKALQDFAGKLVAHAVSGRVNARDDVGLLFDGMSVAVSGWSKCAAKEVRQVPDPALVALGKGLETSPYSPAFFARKLEKLIAGFDTVQQIGKVTLMQTQPLQPVLVVDGHRGSRLALARRETRWEPIDTPSGAHRELGPEQKELATGRWVFDSWVDRSLAPIARGIQAPHVLTASDTRWQTPPGDHSWSAVTSEKEEDVQMLAIDQATTAPSTTAPSATAQAATARPGKEGR